MTTSATDPDWSRELRQRGEWSPGKCLLAAIRSYQRHAGGGLLARGMRAAAVLRHRRWTRFCSSDIPLTTRIGGGLLLPHPFAIVIHPMAEIGVNCLIFQGVTLGTRGPDSGVPRIGGHVDIGAGAKLLGGITVGDHAVIGANAVVLEDVPAHATVVGIPARVR